MRTPTFAKDVRSQLIVDPRVPSDAKHVAAPVPWHFRDKVKTGLDADCRMGVLLEEVPALSPMECMPRMITPSKKSGDPRRTMDLSDLNRTGRSRDKFIILSHLITWPQKSPKI